jgi:hypothetical protein
MKKIQTASPKNMARTHTHTHIYNFCILYAIYVHILTRYDYILHKVQNYVGVRCNNATRQFVRRLLDSDVC